MSKELRTKRATIKGRLTKFKNYLEQTKSISMSDIEANTLQLKLDKIKILSNEYDSVQNQIDVQYASDDEALNTEIDERDFIESMFESLISLAQSMLDKCSVKNNISSSKVNCPSQSQCMVGFKLPNIQIKKFGGSYSKWLEFHDTYKSLIHDNETLQPIHKFHYLNSYLEGEAAQVVANLEVCASNYDKAWDLLGQRYNNKRQLVTNHLNSLLNIEYMGRESEKSLRIIVDQISKDLRALANLGEPTDKWDTLVIHLISQKLDGITHQKWEEQRNSLGSNSPITITQFLSFLKNRADILETCRVKRQGSSSMSNKAPSTSKSYSFTAQQEESSASNPGAYNKFTCNYCNSNHSIYKCPEFLAKTPEQRNADVIKLKLCVNCLRKNHTARQCTMGPCRECRGRHNSLLHKASPSAPRPPQRAQRSQPPGAQLAAVAAEESAQSTATELLPPPVVSCAAALPPLRDEVAAQMETQVMLCTAIIKIINPETKASQDVRCLLDSGSTTSFITKDLQESLKLKTLPTCRQLLGIGNVKGHLIQETSVIQLESLQSNYRVKLAVNILPQLTSDIPKRTVDMRYFNLPASIKLADPSFNIAAPIQALIGADLFWQIIGPEQRSLGKTQPFLRSSQLGWLISGPIIFNCEPSNVICNFSRNDNTMPDQLDQQMSRFWELEELPKKSLLSDSEKACEQHFQNNTTRLESGRFCVRLPLKDAPDCLGDTYVIAKKRLESLEKRFCNNPNLKKLYSEFISEYEELGHCSDAPEPRPEPGYFLCHHAVLREQSESTKIRVVFNPSVPSTGSQVSLNDLQYVGPQVQDSLFSILLRFRQHKYVLSGDVEKLFRQIQLHEDDRNLQLFLWREEESQSIRTLRLNTVTYGFTSATYLSTKCLWTLGEQCPDENIKTIIQHDFYCDDLLTGASSETELLHILNSVTATLKQGCFNLRKFKSNLPSIFHQASNIDLQGNLTLSDSSSALGIGWNPKTDNLLFTIEVPACNENDNITKRSILSSTFKIFDPLGIWSPSTVQPKLIMQQLWLRKLDWDEPIPQDLKKEWLRIQASLQALTDIELPRRTICDNPVTTELHSFCDASKLAYGACVYLRSTNEQGKVHVKLLCAKSRVAPTKPPLTIPRLELLGALLAANLSKAVLEALRCPITRCVHWCDSKVVLAWLNSSPSRLKSFVANKVVEICENTNLASWRHVPTAFNPADHISRGISADKLLQLQAWWTGPAFLEHDEDVWPPIKPETQENNLPVESHLAEYLPEEEVLAVELEDPIVQFERFSKFSKIKRTFAFVFRFIHNLKNTRAKRSGPLTVEELEHSFLFLARRSQSQSYPKETQVLHKKREIPVKSNILSLSPFLDDNGVMRAGGRLDASTYAYAKKHPIILDPAHPLTKLFFQFEHLRLLHCGAQLLLCATRETVWAPSGRKLARRVVRDCVVCNRHKGRTLTPMMGNLPSQRIEPAFPFQTIGMDFAGPFMIINKKGRGARKSKCYLGLFVCFRTKCVHLEAVTELSKEAFILSFRRFISRRGKPAQVFSDNGRNFISAAKEIGKFIKDNAKHISDFAANEQIKFQFHPPYAPHFSGLAEAGIKSAKQLIRRVLGNNNLTFEEITTLFAQVEAILNSRPLHPMSADPHDFLSLTPGHFIIGRPVTALPAPPMEGNEAKSNPVSRYAKIEKMRQEFWHRWQRDYICELQKRTKWKRNTNTIQVNDLVLIQEDNVPPLNWRLGRISKLIEGQDGICRVADITTSRGLIRRALTRLCPLPKSENDC